MRATSILTAVGALTLAVGVPAQEEGPGARGLAPDGGRGLGSETEARDVLALFRSNDPEDVAFRAELQGLVADVRLQLADLENAYRDVGYFELVDADGAGPGGPRGTGGPRGPGGIGGLHAAWEHAAARPVETLAGPEPRARALARALLDPRFRLRRRLLRDWEDDARDLDGGHALLHAGAWSQVLLDDATVRTVAARVDLAASRLRALKKDLEALRQKTGGARTSGPSDDDVRALVAAARAPERGQALLAVAAAEARAERAANQMWGALYRARLEPATRELVDWRARSRARAAGLLEQAVELHPDIGSEEDVPADVARLEKSERIRRALALALSGLALDPLDEELTWIAAESNYFQWGGVGSRSLYERYLALRGIRPWDHRTYQDRARTAREERALWVAQSR